MTLDARGGIPRILTKSQFIRPPKNVGDPGQLGAGCRCLEGFYTFNALARNVSQVIAVEPLPSIAFSLERSVKQWGAQDRVRIVQNALADRQSGAEMLTTNTDLPWESRLQTGRHTASSETATVIATTVDALVAENGLSGDGILKMDVEGSEMMVLEGGRQALATLSPRLDIAVYQNLQNAELCRDIILAANPQYNTEFRGVYGWFKPARPYMLFGWVPGA